MKKFALLLSLVSVAGVSAQEMRKAEPTQTNDQASATKVKEISAEVVAVASDGKALTIKGEMGDKTAPVDDKAVASVKTLKPGDKPTLVCRENANGEQSVTAVRMPDKR
jgi:Cu/Ag efflux protein CusF